MVNKNRETIEDVDMNPETYSMQLEEPAICIAFCNTHAQADRNKHVSFSESLSLPYCMSCNDIKRFDIVHFTGHS